MLDDETRRFLQAALTLAPPALARAFDRAVELRRQGGREASRAAKPSAAQNSHIEHTVRTGLRARLAELDEHSPELLSDAKSVTAIAARAVLKRANLTGEQYRILTEPFTAEGVPVPEHPAA